MQAKEKDKIFLLQNLPEVKPIVETIGNTKIDNISHNGSVFVSLNEFVFITSKRNKNYKIPWKDVRTLIAKNTLLSNKIYIKCLNKKEFEFSFSSSDSVNSIDVLFKAIRIFNNNYEQWIKEKEELIKNTNSMGSLTIQEEEKLEKFTNHLDLTYTKAKKLEPSFIVLDFETTGLKYQENEIIQYGIIEYENGIVK